MNEKAAYRKPAFTGFIWWVCWIIYAAIPLQVTAQNTDQTGEIRLSDSLSVARKWYDDGEYEKSLKLCLRLHERYTPSSTEYRDNLLLISRIFKQIGNYRESLHYYTELIKLPDITGLKRILYKITIAKLLYYTGNRDSSLQYQKKILWELDTLQGQESDRLKALSYSNIAAFYFNRNMKLAEHYSLLALDYYLQTRDSVKLASLYNNLANIYIGKKQYRKAKKYLMSTLSYLPEKRENLNTLRVVYFNLAWVLYLLKDYRSFKYAEKSFDIQDSLANIEVREALTRIEKEYNVERTRKEGELKASRERAKREKAQLYSIIVAILGMILSVGGWAAFRYRRIREKIKLERLEAENKEKILNATIDGKESERKMIAETLHHEVNALLSSANLHLEALKMKLSKPYSEEIEKTKQIVGETADKIRNLSHTLVSSVLIKFGLGYAVQELSEKHSNDQLRINCKCENIGRYSDEFELRIYHIITELLNNIIKHSQADTASIELKETDYFFSLKVKDNGKGFDTKKMLYNGLGIRQIQMRISQMKGTFEVYSHRGTKITILIPAEQIKKFKRHARQH